jgi:drug/metabolite transporter (DMT)-like permease
VFAAGCTSTVDAFAKLLASDLHSLVIVWGYACGLFALVLPYLLWLNVRGTPMRTLYFSARWPVHMVRTGCLIGSIGTLFLSLTYIPLIDATAVMFMSPLFVNLLAGPMLGEKVSLHRWLGVLAGLCGVLVIIQPGGTGFDWPIIYAIIAAVFFALFQIFTRSLAPTETTVTTLFYTGFGGVAWSSLLVLFVWQPLNPEHILVFLGLGLLGVAAHFSYIKAFQLAQASFLAPFTYSKILWTTVLGYVFFAHIPGLTVLAGAAFIVAGGLYVFWREADAT